MLVCSQPGCRAAAQLQVSNIKAATGRTLDCTPSAVIQPLVMDYLPACIQVGMMKGIVVEKWLQFDTKERAGNLTKQLLVYIHTTF